MKINWKTLTKAVFTFAIPFGVIKLATHYPFFGSILTFVLGVGFILIMIIMLYWIYEK